MNKIYIKLSTNKNADTIQELIDLIADIDILDEYSDKVTDILNNNNIDYEV